VYTYSVTSIETIINNQRGGFGIGKGQSFGVEQIEPFFILASW